MDGTRREGVWGQGRFQAEGQNRGIITYFWLVNDCKAIFVLHEKFQKCQWQWIYGRGPLIKTPIISSFLEKTFSGITWKVWSNDRHCSPHQGLYYFPFFTVFSIELLCNNSPMNIGGRFKFSFTIQEVLKDPLLWKQLHFISDIINLYK